MLDHSNPDTVYLSRQVNGVFEIEQWTTRDLGKTWSSVPVTHGSAYDNVRPVVVRNYRSGDRPELLWMQTQNYVHYTNFSASIKMDIPGK